MCLCVCVNGPASGYLDVCDGYGRLRKILNPFWCVSATGKTSYILISSLQFVIQPERGVEKDPVQLVPHRNNAYSFSLPNNNMAHKPCFIFMHK